MRAHVIIFAVGLVTGIALALLWGVRDPGGNRPATVESPGPGPTDKATVPEPDARRAAPATTNAIQAPDRDDPAPIGLPAAYRDLVALPPQRTSAAAFHEMFEHEPRDEAWATSMETGVRHHMSSNAGDSFVEYVECRTTLCEIAGFETGAGRGFGSIYRDMQASGWWQAQGQVLYLNGSAAGLRRFVIIVSRHENEG